MESFNADTLLYISTFIGVYVVYLLIKVGKYFATKTKTQRDDKMLAKSEEFNGENLTTLKSKRK